MASGVTRGTQYLPGNQSWMTTLWFQILFPGLVCLGAFFIPESPRWLYVNGKAEQAKAMLTKFHGGGNSDSVWVSFQMQEYEQYLELDGSDKRWWDYRALFKNRNTWNRLFCNCAIQAMGQEAGNCGFLHNLLNIYTLTLTTNSRPLLLPIRRLRNSWHHRPRHTT